MSSTDLWAMGGNGGMIQFNSLNASTPSMGSEFAHVEGGMGLVSGATGTVSVIQ